MHTVDLAGLPTVKTSVMINLANPAAAYRWWRLPASGIGLARMEFVVANVTQVHPMALVHFDRLQDATAKEKIARLTAGYDHKSDYFVDNLARGFGALCATVYPKPAILRMSDFKTNKYARLIGGKEFEPKEENPMIGFRGASRYYSPHYHEGFTLECRAIKVLREKMGFTNAIVMIPFCRTIREAQKVLDIMAENGLHRGENGLKVYMMCEIPSNIILASRFMEYFDGFSIKSNDLTQLTLGVNRDSSELSDLFDEPASHLQIAPNSVDLNVVGIHGPPQVAAWSTATIGGVLTDKCLASGVVDRVRLERECQDRSRTIIQWKGTISFGIGSVVSSLCSSILSDKRDVRAVSYFQPELGCCFSLPAVIGKAGVVRTIQLPLNREESS